MLLKSDEWFNMMDWMNEIIDETEERNYSKTVKLGKDDAVVPLAVLYEWNRTFVGEYDKLRANCPQAIMDIRRCLIYGENDRPSDIDMVVESSSFREPIILNIMVRRHDERKKEIYLDIIVRLNGDPSGDGVKSVNTFCLSTEDENAYEYFGEYDTRYMLRNYRPEIVQCIIDLIEQEIPKPSMRYQVIFERA